MFESSKHFARKLKIQPSDERRRYGPDTAKKFREKEEAMALSATVTLNECIQGIQSASSDLEKVHMELCSFPVQSGCPQLSTSMRKSTKSPLPKKKVKGATRYQISHVLVYEKINVYMSRIITRSCTVLESKAHSTEVQLESARGVVHACSTSIKYSCEGCHGKHISFDLIIFCSS